ncbi:MAG: oligoendopeptidase F, partial [Aggregatilineales bacterium]
MSTAVKVVERAEIPQEQTWNREIVFADVAAWQAEFEAVQPEVAALSDYAGKLNDPATLAEALEKFSAVQRRVATLGFYAGMESSVDSSNDDIKPLLGQVSGLGGQLRTNTAYAEPELLEIGETLLQWADEHDALKMYKTYFENLLRRKPHIRSAEVEQVLGMASDAFGTMRRTAGELTGTDLQFDPATGADDEPFDVTQSSIDTTKEHPDREIRRTAWNNYADAYLSMKNTLANAYIGSVKHNVFNARVR